MRARSLRSRVPRVAVAAAPLVERRESAERLSHDYPTERPSILYRVIVFGVATVFIAERVRVYSAVPYGIRTRRRGAKIAELDALRPDGMGSHARTATHGLYLYGTKRCSVVRLHVCERADSCERTPLKSFRLHTDRNTLKVKQRSSKPRQRGQRVLHEEVSRRRYEEEGVDPIEQPAVAGEQVARVLHVGRALEQRDSEVSDERHHGAHDAVERAWLGLG